MSPSTDSSSAGIRLRRGVALDLRHRNAAVTYAVDCRMIFMGDRVRRLLRAFEEALFHYESAADPQILHRRLSSSAEILEFYEVEAAGDDVSIRLRDRIFQEAGPIDDLELVVEVRDGRRTLRRPLSPSRLRALGALLPLLKGTSTEADIASRLRAALPAAEAAWAIEFLEILRKEQYLDDGIAKPMWFSQPPPSPRVTLLAHSSLLVQSRQTTLLVDPVLRADQRPPDEAFDVFRLGVDAILCSHGHWDHCDLQTLLWFDKQTPILVPRLRRATAFNPPVAPALALLGFTDVREVDHWTPIQIGEFEIVPIPFHGEQDEPGAEIDHYTYVIRTEGLSLYGGVDSYEDSFGTMPPVLARVREQYAPQIAFLPISKMVYEYRHGGVNGFCRYLDRRLYGESFQYTASAEDAAQWVAALEPRWACPYAIFAFPRWWMSPEIAEFAGALGRRGLEERLYPLRPLDRLDRHDLEGGFGPTLRRRLRLAWSRVATILLRQNQRLAPSWPYRVVRQAVRTLLAARSPAVG